jgi:hypothetical protein
MTDDRNKSTPRADSVARPTARDVPFTRGAGSESEPAPRGQRPGQLPRDPTYEAELAQVELAVLRDPQPRDDPSTKQGGRLAQQTELAHPPESVTPESPGAQARREVLSRSPEPPSSGGRSVASGTLLSVGAVDPRGKTERTLETPRMFISQQQGTEAYFKPGKIPAVTVHQSIESETIKLSDSIDPRRAKTIPRFDRAVLAQLSELEPVPDSEMPFAVSRPASSLDVSSARSPRWNQEQWDAEEESLRSVGDGQIHASLSPFREQATASFSLEGAPTRAEPLAARRSDVPEAPSSATPDTSVVPTHRDLPVHRIEASQPPPPPPPSSPVSQPQSFRAVSQGPEPTTASIAAEEPERRAVWMNYVAFAAALVLAVVVGLYLTRGSEEQASPPKANPVNTAPMVMQTSVDPPPVTPVQTPPADKAEAKAEAVPAPVAAPPAPRRTETQAAPLKAPAPAIPAPAPSRKSSNPKAVRETIF